MENNSITASIEVAKSPQEVFNCIPQVSKWWTKDVAYITEGKNANLNDEFTITHPGTHYSKQKVVELLPNQRIVWLVTESKLDWLEKEKEEWTNTKLIFEISTKKDKTTLHFTHEGLTPEKESYARVAAAWNIVITDWLCKFISEGKTI